MEFIVWMGIIVWTGRTNSAEGGVVGGRGTIIGSFHQYADKCQYLDYLSYATLHIIPSTTSNHQPK
jgi:hypothetical protein